MFSCPETLRFKAIGCACPYTMYFQRMPKKRDVVSTFAEAQFETDKVESKVAKQQCHDSRCEREEGRRTITRKREGRTTKDEKGRHQKRNREQ